MALNGKTVDISSDVTSFTHASKIIEWKSTLIHLTNVGIPYTFYGEIKLIWIEYPMLEYWVCDTG